MGFRLRLAGGPRRYIPKSGSFAGPMPRRLEKALTGAKLLGSEGHGKQMLFRFSGGASVGIHLGMSGRLRVESLGFPRQTRSLVLFQEKRSLVYSDPRMFGRVRFALGKGEPEWWTNLPPAVISPALRAPCCVKNCTGGSVHRSRRYCLIRPFFRGRQLDGR